jgi:L-asparaginase/Glu-tRNA(Gln) amidotransferase subunit D
LGKMRPVVLVGAQRGAVALRASASAAAKVTVRFEALVDRAKLR